MNKPDHLPTEITVGDRVYEVLFIRLCQSGHNIILEDSQSRQQELSYNDEEYRHVLFFQGDIPRIFDGKAIFVFLGEHWEFPRVSYILRDGWWKPSLHNLLLSSWRKNCRFLRRK